MAFTEQHICTSRMNCFHCRNNEQFRSQMEKQFGKWECPIDLPIGAPLEDMPQETKDQVNKQKEAQEQHKKRIDDLENAIFELEQVVEGDAIIHLNTIRTYALPNSKTAEKCQNSGDSIGEVDQECCGGKISKVPAFSCSLHTITTNKKCSKCNDFRQISS